MNMDDLAAFARHHVSSGDIDPAYPVIGWMERDLELDEDAAIWHTLVYVAYYNLTSAVQVWQDWDWMLEALRAHELSGYSAGPLKLPTGIERRGLRDGSKMARHLLDLQATHQLYGSWWEALSARGLTWGGIVDSVRAIYNNGRWAGYKTAELLKTVHGWPISAPDMGNDGSSGPVDGLKLVYPDLDLSTVDAQDAAAEALRDRLSYDHDIHLPWEQLETVLCDWHAMCEGRYYVGHDIDQQLEQVMRPEVPAEARQLILRARAATLPHAYLGELGGWDGVDKARAKAYAVGRGVIIR